MWTTLVSYKETNVVHKKVENVVQNRDKMWFKNPNLTRDGDHGKPIRKYIRRCGFFFNCIIKIFTKWWTYLVFIFLDIYKFIIFFSFERSNRYFSHTFLLKDYCLSVEWLPTYSARRWFCVINVVHKRFSVSEQTLNSHNHGVNYMSVITRLTCNNSILLTRNSPDWQTYRDDTADDTVCSCSVYFWHCFNDDGFMLMACVRSQRKHTYVLADTHVITYVIPSVMSSRHGGLSCLLPSSLSHVATEIYRSLSLCHVTWIDQSRTSIHPQKFEIL